MAYSRTGRYARKPTYRRRTTRRRTTRRTSTIPRTGAIVRAPRPVRDNYTFTRYSATAAVWLSSPYSYGYDAVGGGGGTVSVSTYTYNKAFTFTLSDVMANPEFTNLFSQYRIKRCDIEVTPSYAPTSADLSSAPGPTNLMLRYIYNNEDNNENQMNTEDYWASTAPNVRNVPLISGKTVVIPVPKVSALTGVSTNIDNVGNSIAVMNRPVRSPWIDTDQPTIPHLGVKMQVWTAYQNGPDIPGPTGGSYPKATFRIKYTLEFKGIQ